EDLAHPHEAHTFVRELLDATQQMDVLLGVPPAAALGAGRLDETLALVDAQRLRVDTGQRGGDRDDVEVPMLVRHLYSLAPCESGDPNRGRSLADMSVTPPGADGGSPRAAPPASPRPVVGPRRGPSGRRPRTSRGDRPDPPTPW